MPVFTADMNQHVVSEATQPGTSVYILQASSQKTPEDVRFFIRGTETFIVDELSGQVTLNEPLDREVSSIFFCCCEKCNSKVKSRSLTCTDERLDQAHGGREGGK